MRLFLARQELLSLNCQQNRLWLAHLQASEEKGKEIPAIVNDRVCRAERQIAGEKALSLLMGCIGSYLAWQAEEALLEAMCGQMFVCGKLQWI